jgi:hypothetical protein
MHEQRVFTLFKPGGHYYLDPIKRNVASRVVGTPVSQFRKLVWEPVINNFQICHVPLQSLKTNNGKYSEICHDFLLPSHIQLN